MLPVADAVRIVDAEYIAAMNPRIALELLDDYEAACRMLLNLGYEYAVTDIKDELLEELRREIGEMMERP